MVSIVTSQRCHTEDLDPLAASDQVLLRKIYDIAPSPLDFSKAKTVCWVLTQDESDWICADDVSMDMVAVEPEDVYLLQEAAMVALAIDRELRWYFQERSSGLLGWRRDPAGTPCARTVFARHLQRYAASSLRALDRALLDAWCELLARVITERIFSNSNWLWSSRFEQCLAVCLERMQGVRLLLQAERRQLRRCKHSREEVEAAVARREGSARVQASCLPPRIALRGISWLERLLLAGKVALRNKLPGGELVHHLAAKVVGGRISSALHHNGLQFAAELFGYAIGEIDAYTLLEDAAVTAGSATVFAFVPLSWIGLCVADPALVLVLQVLGPPVASACASRAIRTAGSRCFHADRRRLRAAFQALGLSPLGADQYTVGEIEEHLEWMLQQGREDSLTLWSAYVFIREHQHPGLSEPWQPTPPRRRMWPAPALTAPSEPLQEGRRQRAAEPLALTDWEEAAEGAALLAACTEAEPEPEHACHQELGLADDNGDEDFDLQFVPAITAIGGAEDEEEAQFVALLL